MRHHDALIFEPDPNDGTGQQLDNLSALAIGH